MLEFHDGHAIYGNTMVGDTLYVSYRQRDGYPERTIPYSRDAAVPQALSILRQLAPWKLVGPERTTEAERPVVVQFPGTRVLDLVGRVV
jgi:hypothetical protein